MSEYVIYGGRRLEGELQIDGSKNAVLPIIAATLLNGDITCLKHCPKIADVEIMIQILKQLGCIVKWENDTLVIDTSTLNSCIVDGKLVSEMRSSIILLGALISRCGEAYINQPGGCKLGARPIDLHLKALYKMNVEINDNQGTLICKSSNLQGADIYLEFPSVGATENIMLAAVLAKGNTIIRNAAREPEIVDLQNFLLECGAKITGAGTELIIIEGVSCLHGATYEVIPDRIIAGTYLVAAAITRGHICLENVCTDHIKTIVKKLEYMGCTINITNKSVELLAPNKLRGVDIITRPYPGYPTDMQSQMMALLCTCSTSSKITENLFECRFKTADELNKMGANITVKNSEAYIVPCKRLIGTHVTSSDLRGGAALVIAGLVAEGCTTINNIQYIKRGYQNIVSDLNKLGADIQEKG